MKYTKQQIAESREFLLSLLPRPASEQEAITVYCVLRHVSKSGMSRVISFFVKDADGDLRCIDGAVSRVCSYQDRSTAYPPAKGDGLKVGGCGMDMGFSVVYHLARALYRDENDKPADRAGYLLRSRWL